MPKTEQTCGTCIHHVMCGSYHNVAGFDKPCKFEWEECGSKLNHYQPKIDIDAVKDELLSMLGIQVLVNENRPSDKMLLDSINNLKQLLGLED